MSETPMTEPGSSERLPDERPQRRREYSGASSTLGLAMLIVIAVGVGIWWFEFRDNGSAGGAAGDGYGVIPLPVAANTTGKSAAAQIGRAAPDFRLRAPDGSVATLDSFRGKYVLLNFWASWCVPCQSEAPILQKLTDGTPANLVVLGVNQQEDAGAAKQFEKDFQLTYPVVLDFDGDVSQAYHVIGLPVTFLIGPDGVIQRAYSGPLSDSDIAKLKQEGIL
jgi:peroxiredoxin